MMDLLIPQIQIELTLLLKSIPLNVDSSSISIDLA